MSGWKPIATAPKDGTLVDLWLHGNMPIGRQANCRFDTGFWQYHHPNVGWLNVETLSIKATHWYDFGDGKPMPDAPEVG